jgi:hypothetical protein
VHVTVTFPTSFHLPQGTHGVWIHYLNVTPYYALGKRVEPDLLERRADALRGEDDRHAVRGRRRDPARVERLDLVRPHAVPAIVRQLRDRVRRLERLADAACGDRQPAEGRHRLHLQPGQPTDDPGAGDGHDRASRTTYLSLPLPFDLTAINMPGCRLYAGADLTATGVNTGGTGLAVLAIPSSPALLGQAVYTQAFVVDPGANGFGATLTDAAQLLIGV